MPQHINPFFEELSQRPMSRMPLASIALLFLIGAPMMSQTLLHEDFTSGVANGWTPRVNAWSVSANSYRSNIFLPDAAVESYYQPGFSWRDYAATVKFRMESAYAPSDVQLIYRYSPTDATSYPGQQYGACQVVRDYTHVRLQIIWMAAPSQYGLASTQVQVNTFQWYTLVATIKGNTATCEIVGQPESRITAEFNNWNSHGTVALRATHIPASFDDVLVTSLEEYPCEVSLSRTTLTSSASGEMLDPMVNVSLVLSPSRWTASAPSWITVTPSEGDGTTPIHIAVEPNSGPERTGIVQICNETLTVRQHGEESAGGRTVVVLFSGWSNKPSSSYPQQPAPTDPRTTYGLGDFTSGISKMAYNIANNTKFFFRPEVHAQAFTYFDSVDADRFGVDHLTRPDVGYPPRLHVEAVKWLREKVRLEPGDRLIVVGHSMGGHRAYQFAREFAMQYDPEGRFKAPSALVLIDPVSYDTCSMLRYTTGNCFQTDDTLPSPASGTKVIVMRQAVDMLIRGYGVEGAEQSFFSAGHSDIDDREDVNQRVLGLVDAAGAELSVSLGVEGASIVSVSANKRETVVDVQVKNYGRLVADNVEVHATMEFVGRYMRSAVARTDCTLGRVDNVDEVAFPYLDHGQSATARLSCSLPAFPSDVVPKGIMGLLKAGNSERSFSFTRVF